MATMGQAPCTELQFRVVLRGAHSALCSLDRSRSPLEHDEHWISPAHVFSRVQLLLQRGFHAGAGSTDFGGKGLLFQLPESWLDRQMVLVHCFSVQISGLKILRMVRLARILRIVRVVRFFSELRVMVNGVIGSAKSLCWALLLLVLVNFLFGVLFMQLSLDFLDTFRMFPAMRAVLNNEKAHS
eukprot:g18054.t1